MDLLTNFFVAFFNILFGVFVYLATLTLGGLVIIGIKKGTSKKRLFVLFLFMILFGHATLIWSLK